MYRDEESRKSPPCGWGRSHKSPVQREPSQPTKPGPGPTPPSTLNAPLRGMARGPAATSVTRVLSLSHQPTEPEKSRRKQQISLRFRNSRDLTDGEVRVVRSEVRDLSVAGGDGIVPGPEIHAVACG